MFLKKVQEQSLTFFVIQMFDLSAMFKYSNVNDYLVSN